MVVAARRRSRRRGDGGAAALEFGLVTPVLLLLVLGIIQYGIYFWGMQAGSAAASSLARRLSVGDCQTTAAAQGFVVRRLGPPASTPTVGVAYQDGSGVTMAAPGQVGGNVKVTLSFAVLNLHLPLVPIPGGGTVSSSANARVEDLADPLGGCA
jgi:Flp pilus assembly protein TadG